MSRLDETFEPTIKHFQDDSIHPSKDDYDTPIIRHFVEEKSEIVSDALMSLFEPTIKHFQDDSIQPPQNDWDKGIRHFSDW